MSLISYMSYGAIIALVPEEGSMSQTETRKTQISRRTVAKGAAWSVPVIATAAAAPAASASVVPGQSSASLNYVCSVALSDGGTPVFSNLAWTAVITATMPTSVSPGDSIPAPTITAEVTTDAGSGDNLRALGVTSVSGTSSAPYTVSGDAVNPGTRAADLTIPTTPVPASGGIVTTASGAGAAETAGAATGQITATVGSFKATLQTNLAPLYASCDLAAGESGVLAPGTQVK